MPNLKISQLKPVTNMDPDSFVLVVQKGKNYRMSIKEAIAAYVDLSPYYTKEETKEALNSVDTRIDTLEGLATFRIIPVSYLDLRRLRDNGDLVPGQQYRITDYTCTTTQANTKSAGHQFDIIVTANDESTLNEEARAALHSGDEYFSGCSLNAWKIWYCLDNDTTRFAWADATNGKGVIYRMIDEFNNDVPYDFKNIQFVRFEIVSSKVNSLIGKYAIFDAYYVYVSDDESYWYTFSTNSQQDASLNGYSNGVHNNTILKYIKSTINLNDIVFIGLNNYKNIFGINCYSNTFGNNCRYNTFGSNCYYNLFGDKCRANNFGNNCNHNMFGNDCHSNTIGGDNDDNIFDDNCQYNSFGNGCKDNIFGAYCSYNIFESWCSSIKFASSSLSTTKYSYYRYNHFGDGCQYIVFTGTETASSSQQVQNYNFAQGLRGTASAYLTIDGVRNRAYATKVAKKSNGELKIYCDADLIL